MTPNALHPGDTRRHPRTIIGVVLAFLGAIALTLGVTGNPVAGLEDTDFVPLSNSGADVGDDCPSSVGDYWHFVIAPNDGTYAFVTISLNLGGTIIDFDGSDIISNGGQADNVFVAVPAGYSLGDLVAFGSEAEITPGGYTSSGNVRFVLSHLCDGDESTTTTTTTTTLPETTTTVAETTTTVAETTTTVAETTTTVAETTTTVAETTTTVAETTTTVSESGGPTTTTTLPCEWDPELPPDDPNCYQGTTTSVEASPPTTVGTDSNSPTTVLAQLPKTGPGTTNTMMAIGALMLLIGGVMVLSTRREHAIA
ncbi:MAG: LPXTG cell wall anchor domain-containing protein [Ilumatobacteraceae bacterium]|nr:LPXTG cell wall anchor domain-containing protein [Ilumatobacteraceae bacterium]